MSSGLSYFKIDVSALSPVERNALYNRMHDNVFLFDDDFRGYNVDFFGVYVDSSYTADTLRDTFAIPSQCSIVKSLPR